MTKKRNPPEPPDAWINLLVEHDATLARVRMLWRRGSGPYRPLVPLTVDLGELHKANFDTWADLELTDTHFAWVDASDDGDGRTARADAESRAATEVARLWMLAGRWTRCHDTQCDFQLRGYDHDDEPLFESGRRYCYEAPAVEDPPSKSTPQAEPTEPSERWAALDARKDDLLDKLYTGYGDAMEAAQHASSAAPEVMRNVKEILGQAVSFQDTAARNLVEQFNGNTEVRSRAYSERQATLRRRIALDFGRYAVDAVLGAVVPLAKQGFDAWAHRSSASFPEFAVAQQAMAYLALTLDQHQLGTLFRDNAKASKGFMTLLDESSKIDDERRAISHLKGADTVFRSHRFRSVATAEQQLAARYIIGRAALYRMGEFDEPDQAH